MYNLDGRTFKRLCSSDKDEEMFCACTSNSSSFYKSRTFYL